MRSAWLAVVSVVVAVGAVVAYPLLIRVPLVRNHPGLYVVACALAVALAVLALVRPRGRRWPAWLALGLTTLLLAGSAWFNFIAARIPATATVLHIGERPPDFTLPDADGRPVSLADFRGKKPVVLVFYRGYW
jgi:hypothetical protein